MRSPLALCPRLTLRSHVTTAASTRPATLSMLGREYPTDEMTNVSPTILSKLPLRLHTQHAHPLSTLRALVESHFPSYAHISSLSPLVTPYQNFDVLSFPPDHPGRSATDSYYVNKHLMLRTHTSAHEVDVFEKGETKWLLTADVYRRDEIDGSHYPVFHQTEGARIVSADSNGMKEIADDNASLQAHLRRSNIVIEDVPHLSPINPCQPAHDPKHTELIAKNLKLSLNSLILTLFGDHVGATPQNPLRVRWIEATFPWTTPSFEMEDLLPWQVARNSGVRCRLSANPGQRTQVISRQRPAQQPDTSSDIQNKLGWAFGLGLERIAMILYSIPDIRLFWSQDPRFLTQFKHGDITTFRPYSKYPACFKDVSFWLPKNVDLHDNDFCDLVRDVAGDTVEDVKMVRLSLSVL
ncbi:hypothetical protein J3R82DRAFT_5664 [Butyriboletus roseoflavus]|nr:hypothetical protein J3R82DRAFT_5664 [Butyriboletus roseoflavus]